MGFGIIWFGCVGLLGDLGLGGFGCLVAWLFGFVVVGISCVCELFVSWRDTVVGLRFASVCGGFVFGLGLARFGLDLGG